MKMMIEVIKHDQPKKHSENITSLVYHTSFSTYEVIRDVILLLWLILPLTQGRQHDFQSGGAKTQPILRCYNFSFETVDTWKTSF